MHIFLYGPPGSGKSTVGKLLALAINLPFLDLDCEVETIAGQPISKIMTVHGELAFRKAESSALQNVVSGEDKVVALGGGTLLRGENLSVVEATGQVFLLNTDFSTLITRLSQDEYKRPLLADEIETSLAQLMEHRQLHYDSFDFRVNASQRPEQVAQDIQHLLGRYHVGGMGQGYDVLVEGGGLERLGGMLRSRGLGGPVLVVSDTNVAPLYGKQVLESLESVEYTVSLQVIPAGEAHKTLETVTSLWHGCVEAGLDRESTVVALGGGVVTDLAGFAAATFMRGCKWVAIPTTLLAMVDASIGGKTSFDLPEGKNLIGSFYPPELVLADTETLSSLMERELRSGLAEVVKHGVIADPELFDLCAQGWDFVSGRLPEVIQRGISVKVNIIEQDPYEQGIRASLNFGHTIGHALELVSGFKLLHGEAVAIGMVAEAQLAERLSVAHKGVSDALAKTLSELGLPIKIPKKMSPSELIRTMKVDKKKTEGIVHFALPAKIGEVKVGVALDDLQMAFEEIK